MIRTVQTLAGAAVTTHNYSLVFAIAGVDYRFSFSYSTRMKRWRLTIDHPNGSRVVTGAVCVHGVDLFSYASPGLEPQGFLMLMWTLPDEAPVEPEEFDLGTRSVLLHFDRAEDLDYEGPQVPQLA